MANGLYSENTLTLVLMWVTNFEGRFSPRFYIFFVRHWYEKLFVFFGKSSIIKLSKRKENEKMEFKYLIVKCEELHDKPFCYNIGYTILNVDNDETLVKRDYVVEQVWHNPMLFITAYYANKREGYVAAMRSRKTIMAKYGYICQAMIRDFVKFEVVGAYAFNSPFDDKVFTYNSDS